MKTKIFIILLLFVAFANAVNAQQQEVIEIRPFGTDNITTQVKRGHTVKFKISNVNTFKIQGFTTSEVSNFNYNDLPAIFNVEIPGLDEIAQEGKENATPGLAPDSVDFNKDKKEGLLGFYAQFITTYSQIQQQITLEEKIARQLTDSIFIRDTAFVKNSAEKYFESAYKKDTSKSRTEVVTNLDSLIIWYSRLKLAYDSLNKNAINSNIKVEGELKTADKNSTFKVEGTLVNQNKNLAFAEEMAFAKKVYDSIVNPENRQKIIEKAERGIDLYEKVKRADFTVYTDGEQILDDIVTITPKLKDSKGQVVYEFKPLTLKAKGGMKVNFSSGYLLSFIGDDVYNLRKNDKGEAIGVSKGNSTSMTHALGGLIHVYASWPTGIGLGGSTGISATTDGTIGFYIGPSLFFQGKNRLVLTGGLSLTKVNKLNNANLDENMNFINPYDTEIKYDNIYKSAFFIGITFNLTKQSN